MRPSNQSSKRTRVRDFVVEGAMISPMSSVSRHAARMSAATAAGVAPLCVLAAARRSTPAFGG